MELLHDRNDDRTLDKYYGPLRADFNWQRKRLAVQKTLFLMSDIIGKIYHSVDISQLCLFNITPTF